MKKQNQTQCPHFDVNNESTKKQLTSVSTQEAAESWTVVVVIARLPVGALRLKDSLLLAVTTRESKMRT